MPLAEGVELKEIWIKNFKSLKDVKVRLGEFNLLIGPNRSGKTNFLEALELLKAVYFPRPGEVNPFLRWWGYDRVVWRRDESLPITIGLSLAMAGRDVKFEVTFTGIGGKFALLKEVVEVNSTVRLEKVGSVLKIKHDPEFLNRGLKEAEGNERVKHLISSIRAKSELANYSVDIRGKGTLLKDVIYSLTEISLENVSILYSPAKRPWLRGILLLSPNVDFGKQRTSFIMFIRNKLLDLLNNILVLKAVEPRKIKEVVSRPAKEKTLTSDASNLHNVLYNLFMENRAKMPPRIEKAIKDIFGPDVYVSFMLTEDGRIFMRVYEGDMPLDPPMISDGFYKALVVLTAIETRPSILVIDELENALHPKAIQRLIDELKNAGCTVIAVTHSPAVVDIVDPEDIVLVDRDEEGATVMKRVEDPEALKRKLAERGITLSEGWLYGRIA